MPELPEVETVAESLRRAILGKTVSQVELRREGLRAPFPPRLAEQLKNRKIEAIARRAKYITWELTGGLTLIAHLGMSGRFSVHAGAAPKPGKHDHMIVAFTDGATLVYNDPRRFGRVELAETGRLEAHALFAHLGAEPLGNGFNEAYLAETLSTRKTSVKLALMDQELVVGVGNIYASEALFEAGIDPQSEARECEGVAGEIVSAVRKVLKAAIASGGSSLRDFFDADGQAGYFQHAFKVYGRAGKPCLTCSERIQRIVQGGRSTFFCPGCQKRPKNAEKNPGEARKTRRLRG